jgi:protein O-GlcNAc transferase
MIDPTATSRISESINLSTMSNGAGAGGGAGGGGGASTNGFRHGGRELEVVLTDRGTQLKLSGNVDDGLKHYVQAIQANPCYAPAYYNIGVVYGEANELDKAVGAYQLAVQCDPDHAESLCNLGVIHKMRGQLHEAIALYRRSARARETFELPRLNLAVALTDLGTALKLEGRVKDGKHAYLEALYFNPMYGPAYYNLGVLYAEQGQLHKRKRAAVYYELCVRFQPDNCDALNNLGALYRELDRCDSAVACYKRALQVRPDFVQSLNNLGVIYTGMGRFEEAHEYLAKALSYDANYVTAHNNMGVLYRDAGLVGEALASYEACLALDPLNLNAAQNRLLALNYTNETLESDVMVFEQHHKWGRELLASTRDARAQIELLRASVRDQQQQQQHAKQHSNHQQRRDPIRVAYMSGDFFTHSVSYFIEALLRNHDRTRVHITCYSCNTCADAKTAMLRALADQWRDVASLSADAVARMIVADRIDILVELSGHTAANRLSVMALKPAPVQVTYIGYPNTTGLDTIDYRLTDDMCDPLSSAQRFSETLVRLPRCFLCYTPASTNNASGPNEWVLPEVKQLPALTNGYWTFGSFNHLAKITERVIRVWSRILVAVPTARLYLKAKAFACAVPLERVRQLFTRYGVLDHAERVMLMPYKSHTFDHLDAYNNIDMALDSFPYAGTTTTCEAMVMGVPTLTLVGHNHAHNVGASLMRILLTDADIAHNAKAFADAKAGANVQDTATAAATSAAAAAAASPAVNPNSERKTNGVVADHHHDESDSDSPTRASAPVSAPVAADSELNLGIKGSFITYTEDEYVQRAVAFATMDWTKFARLRQELRQHMLNSSLCDGPAMAQAVEREFQKMMSKYQLLGSCKPDES